MSVASYDRKDSKTQYMIDLKKLLRLLMQIVYDFPSKYRNALTDNMINEIVQCITLSYRANGVSLTSQKAKNVSLAQYNMRRECLNEIISRVLACNALLDEYFQAIRIHDSKEVTNGEVRHEYNQILAKQGKIVGVDITIEDYDKELEQMIRKAQTRRGKRLHKLSQVKQEVGSLTDSIIKNIQDNKKRDNDLKKYIKEDELILLLKEILNQK